MQRQRDGGRVTVELVLISKTKEKYSNVHARVVGEDTTACGRDVVTPLGVDPNARVDQITCDRCRDWVVKETS